MKRLTILLLLAALTLSGCGKKPGIQAKTGSGSRTEKTEAVSSDLAEEEKIAESESVKASETAEPTAAPTASPAPTAEPTPTTAPAPTAEPTPTAAPEPSPEPVDTTPQPVYFDASWEFGENSVINTGNAVLYKAAENRKDLVIGVNAGHGCEGGASVYTYCHPDGTPKVTGGSTAEGAVQAMSCAVGMTFYDGTPERDVTLAEAQILKELLLENGYDVLMIRDGEDVQLDNIARTLLCNRYADCHIAIHWDGDSLDYDKGAYYMSVPDALKSMYPVSETWEKSDHLGDCLISGLISRNCAVFESGSMPMDLTQTSYSKVPSIDIELGNAASDHSQPVLENLAQGLLAGIDQFFS